MEAAMDGPIGRILAWGSVSYVFGFITITAHTARLGLPIVELIEPIYIWVGLPLAGVMFFWRQIWRYFVNESKSLTNELRSAIEPFTEKPASDNDLADESFNAIMRLPYASLVLRGSVKRYLQRFFTENAERLKKRAPDTYARQVYLSRIFSRMYAALAGISRILSLSVNAIAMALAVFIYIWIVYPSIPLSIGGGKPADVRLVVKTNAIPPFALALNSAVFDGTKEAATTVLDAKILYLSKDFVFAELPSKLRISFKSDVVQAIVWHADRSEGGR
jgi:hypothetical protein